MNTRLVNTAADVINAALTQNRTAAGIALALDSAQLLMCPETAAELVVTAGQNEESTTGYIVTALEAPSEYDEEADA